MLLAGIHRAGASVAFVECRNLNKAIALRGCKPGLGPAAEILSLRRQRKNSKKGDPGVAPPKGGSRLCSTKNGKARNSPAALLLGTCACKRMSLRRRQHAARNPCYTSNSDPSFSIFCTTQTAATHGNCRKSKATSKSTATSI